MDCNISDHFTVLVFRYKDRMQIIMTTAFQLLSDTCLGIILRFRVDMVEPTQFSKDERYLTSVIDRCRSNTSYTIG